MKRNLLLLWTLLEVGGLMGTLQAQSLVPLGAQGTSITTPSGHQALLRGANLGQWLLMEGFMSGSNGGMSQGDMKRKLYDSGLSETQIEAYFRQWRTHFITRADIDFLASRGFNCLRLPLHYELFLTPAQRSWRNQVIYADGSAKAVAYETYKAKLQSWVATDSLANADSLEIFGLIDTLISWCHDQGMYLILDMHAVPGTVGDTRNITDELMTARDFFLDARNQAALIRIWDRISERYRDQPVIAMYDLINEPHRLSETQMGQLRDAYEQIITHIRENGDSTLIVIQGNEFGNQYRRTGGTHSLFPADFSHSEHLVYSIHRYRFPNNLTESNPWGHEDHVGYFADAMVFQNRYKVPMLVGETGLDDDYDRLAGNFNLMDELGFSWTLWTHKHHRDDGDRKCPADIPGPGPWDDIGQWQNGQLFDRIRWDACSPNPHSAYWEAISPRYPLISGGLYKILHFESGKAIEADPSGSVAVYQAAYRGDSSQLWQVSQVGDQWQIRHLSSGAILNLDAGENRAGLAGPDTDDMAHWSLSWIGGHAYHIIHVPSQRPLGLEGGSTQSGAPVVAGTLPVDDAEKWILVPIYLTWQGETVTPGNGHAALRVYPNPTDDTLWITARDYPVTVTLFQPNGVQLTAITQAQPAPVALPVQTLPRGLYYLRIESGGQVAWEPFLRK